MCPEMLSPYSYQDVKTLSFTGSKSILQRLLILVATQAATIEIENYNPCADVLEMETALRTFGYTVKSSGLMRQFSFDPDLHTGSDHRYQFMASATGYRFWLTFLATRPGLRSELSAAQALYERGIEPLVTALRNLGAELSASETTIRIIGKQLPGGELGLPGSLSSHFASSLLLCAPGFEAPLMLRIGADQVSMPYIRLTADLLMLFGAKLEYSDCELCVNPGKLNLPKCYRVEGDASTAAALAIGAAILRRPVHLKIALQSALQQADYRGFEILAELGMQIKPGKDGVAVIPARLTGGQVDLADVPDLMPSLSILALFCESPLTLSGIGRLKSKESDRFAGIVKALEALGAKHEAHSDAIRIYPLEHDPIACTLDTQNDHRLVMAFTFLHLAFPGIHLSETASVHKSSPEFLSLIRFWGSDVSTLTGAT